MIETTYIGSGDISALLLGKDTQGYLKLMQRFVSGIVPYHNAKNSPIDALRIGAILEERFYLTLDESWQYQYYVSSKEMDVFHATLDFAKMDKGKVVDFIELKTMNFVDYIEMIEPIRNSYDDLLRFIKTKKKNYYNQVQEQLYCTSLDRAHLCFLSVLNYNDEDNYKRNIQEREYTIVEIPRDEKVIEQIKQRGLIFQQIKDNFKI